MVFLSIFVLRLSLGSSMKPWNKENSIAFADIATFYIVLLETQNLIVSLLAVYSGIRNFHSTTLIKIIQAEWFLYRVAFFLPVVRNCVEIVIFFLNFEQMIQLMTIISTFSNYSNGMNALSEHRFLLLSPSPFSLSLYACVVSMQNWIRTIFSYLWPQYDINISIESGVIA